MIFQDTYKKGPKDADGLPYKLKKIETKIKRLQYSRMFIDCMTRQSHFSAMELLTAEDLNISTAGLAFESLTNYSLVEVKRDCNRNALTLQVTKILVRSSQHTT